MSMRDAAEVKGFAMGWADAQRYATGDKRDRAAVRRRIAKGEATFANAFYDEYFRALGMRTNAFGQAIADGRLKRTCRPSRLYAIANRVGC
jgi:hypothetical protein